MNILHIVNYSPEFGGGIAQHLYALGRNAKSNGHNFFLGFPKIKEWQKRLKDVSEVVIIPEIENPIRSRFPRILRRLCEQKKIDVIHFHFLFALPFSLSFSLRSWNIPVIYHWHNPPVALNNFLTPKTHFKGKLKRLFSGLVAWIADKRVIKKHISISREISNLLVTNNWTNEKKVVFLPNGVTIDNTNSRIRNAEINRIPVIGTVANFRQQKDHVTLMQTFSILCKNGCECELWLVGDGPTKQKIVSLTKELGIDSRVRFLGTVTDPSEFYRHFDIFVLSTYFEGHPLVVLEAMSFSLPVVATRISSVPETVKDGVNGLLVNPEDPEDLARAIQKLIEDNQLAKKLGEAGRKFVEQQPTVEDWANQLIDLYEECLKEKG